VDLLAVTGCSIQGGSNNTATTVPCPATKNTTQAVEVTIYDANSYGGPGCDNVTKTFYVRNTGEEKEMDDGGGGGGGGGV
jgi:hypothetical protein